MSNKLSELRRKIDATDKKIVSNLAERFFLTEKVGKYKKQKKMKPFDKAREVEMLAKRAEWANQKKLDEIVVKKIFRFITKLVRERHREISRK